MYSTAKNSKSPPSSVQVLHSPTQIKSAAQLEVGGLYVRKHADINFVSKPFKVVGVDVKSGWINIERNSGISLSGRAKTKLSLRDSGLLPYDDGHWNPALWLEPRK